MASSCPISPRGTNTRTGNTKASVVNGATCVSIGIRVSRSTGGRWNTSKKGKIGENYWRQVWSTIRASHSMNYTNKYIFCLHLWLFLNLPFHADTQRNNNGKREREYRRRRSLNVCCFVILPPPTFIKDFFSIS